MVTADHPGAVDCPDCKGKGVIEHQSGTIVLPCRSCEILPGTLLVTGGESYYDDGVDGVDPSVGGDDTGKLPKPVKQKAPNKPRGRPAKVLQGS